MTSFNKKEFGENLRKARKEKGLSLDNIAYIIGKNATTVGRYEKGEIVPDAEQISLICNELGIYESELFNTSNKIINSENSKNPFNCNELFLYYKAYYPTSNKFGKGKFKLKIYEKPDCCMVDFTDYKTDKIYLTGHLLADGNIAIFILENYKATSPRLEVTEIILNISDGINGLIMGSLYCTNGKYVPTVKKCIISKEDVPFTDEMLEHLKLKENEKNDLISENIWYINIENTKDFEIESLVI